MVMRVCFGILVLLSVINVAEASHQSPNTYLIEQIKPNLTTRSKPTSVKLASVSFLKTDKGIDFSVDELDVKSQCGNMGYTINVSQCSGDLKQSHL